MSRSLLAHRIQHVRLPYPSLSTRVCSKSCSLSRWCHLTISSFAACYLFLLLSIFPSIRVFSNELALCIRWPKYWIFSINPSNEYLALISFRIDQFDLLCSPRDSQESSPAPQFEDISSLVLALFMVQLLHLYMTTGRTIVLTIGSLLAKWCLCFLIRSLFFGLPELSFQGVTVF